jgi:superfamily II DNA or RNA helicase
MLKLKCYQIKSISEFEEYLDLATKFGREKGHRIAFYELNPLPDKRPRYNDQGLEGIPNTCIKIPTGGGKTLVACHMLHSIYEKFEQQKNEKGLVMWLVPTDAIRNQTLTSLRDRKHPYREALDHYFSNNVKVLDIQEALSLKRSDVNDNVCIVVATFGIFRVTDRLRRKAYADNGSLIEHFQNITKNTLEKDESGQVKYSLMNVINLLNPIIIVDEGHHTKAPLSIEMLKSMNPCFVLEYTATPGDESNVIVNITAAELKEENMVKIPIYLTNFAKWQETIREGVEKRKELEKIAKKEKAEYIRPITLIQAELDKEDPQRIHVKRIRDFLISEGIAEEEIAIKTGSQDQITGIDLYSSTCPIRHIITVSALKEGWDNYFAYVLISVANIGARVSVEQTIGRVLRLPRAKAKKNEELNVSYVFTSSKNFASAAKELENGLLANGYTRKDIKPLIDNQIQKSNIYKQEIIDNDIRIPYVAVDSNSPKIMQFFEDLLGDHFDLTKQKISDDISLYYNEDRTQKIDVKEGDELERSRQTRLNIIYDFKDFTKDDLLYWLDRHVLRKEYTQEEKRKFFQIVIDHMINTKKYSLPELSKNCYRLKEQLELQMKSKESEAGRKSFEILEKSGQLLLASVFHKFQQEIEIDNVSDEKFNKHLYEMSGKLNSEELDLALMIDQLENTRWWYRNIEKRDWFIQGWQSDKFYPDFIVKTNKGNYIVIEYKGENLATNVDTKYKNELGTKWASLAGKSYFFFLVEARNVDEIVTKIKKL